MATRSSTPWLSAKLAFAMALAVGTTAIVVGWMLDNSFITIVVPILAMVTYWLVCDSQKDPGLSHTQLGDTLYYLGFLFTLLALLVSLLALGKDRVDVGGLLERFGLALSTTIVGLGLRMYIVNFHMSAEDSLETAERALTRDTRRLRRNFERLSTDMVTQSERIRGTIQQASDDLATEVQETVNKMKTRGEEVTKELTDHAGSVGKTISEKLGKDIPDDLANALKSLTQKLSKEIGDTVIELSKQIQSLRADTHDVARVQERVIQQWRAKLDEQLRSGPLRRRRKGWWRRMTSWLFG